MSNLLQHSHKLQSQKVVVKPLLIPESKQPTSNWATLKIVYWAFLAKFRSMFFISWILKQQSERTCLTFHRGHHVMLLNVIRKNLLFPHIKRNRLFYPLQKRIFFSFALHTKMFFTNALHLVFLKMPEKQRQRTEIKWKIQGLWPTRSGSKINLGLILLDILS